MFYHIDVVCRNIDEPYSTGVALFDRLSSAQQLALLAEVGEAMLAPMPPPKLSAVREATVAILFQELRFCIEEEIESDTPTEPHRYWRTLVRQAIRELPGEDASTLPAPHSPDLDAWDILVECLSDRLLWVDDWAMEADFADAVPETNRRLKEFLGIDDDYFIDVAPDRTDQQMPSIRARLSSLAPRYGG